MVQHLIFTIGIQRELSPQQKRIPPLPLCLDMTRSVWRCTGRKAHGMTSPVVAQPEDMSVKLLKVNVIILKSYYKIRP